MQRSNDCVQCLHILLKWGALKNSVFCLWHWNKPFKSICLVHLMMGNWVTTSWRTASGMITSILDIVSKEYLNNISMSFSSSCDIQNMRILKTQLGTKQQVKYKKTNKIMPKERKWLLLWYLNRRFHRVLVDCWKIGFWGTPFATMNVSPPSTLNIRFFIYLLTAGVMGSCFQSECPKRSAKYPKISQNPIGGFVICLSELFNNLIENFQVESEEVPNSQHSPPKGAGAWCTLATTWGIQQLENSQDFQVYASDSSQTGEWIA